jgi:predicted Zn-dependent peptidase
VNAPAEPQPPDVSRAEIDGLPVLWSDLPERVVACLLFRVGWADEPLPRRGLTHLVEHLALTRGGEDPAYERNGFTTATLTGFVVRGSLEQAVEFLNGVVDGLTNLPLDRLDHEVQVLRAEEHTRQRGVAELLLARRFGAVGFGTGAYEQLGLNGVQPELVTGWRDRWFTAGNAILWISRRPPESLRLRLPPGPRAPTPQVRPLALSLPAIVANRGSGFAIGMMGPRGVETALATSILDHHLRRTLRHELGLSYSAGAASESLDASSVHVVLTADNVPGREGETGDAMVAALRQMADSGPSAEDLERSRTMMRAGLTQPGRRTLGLGELDTAARNHLVGRQHVSWADVVAEYDAIGSEQLAVAVARLAWTAIMVAPPGISPRAVQFHPYPDWSTGVVSGTALVRRATVPGGAPEGTRLVAGEEGISLVDAAGHAVTVRFAQCAAVLRGGAGHRRLIGEDGFSIVFVREEWDSSELLSQSIDERVPAECFVTVPEAVPERTAEPVREPAPEPFARPWQPGVRAVADASCQVCGRPPAITVLLRRVTGMLLLYRIGTLRRTLCRECGIALFRQVSGTSMVAGWWGVIAYFANLVVLALNARQRLRLAGLDAPRGEPAAAPLPMGPSLWARTEIVVPMLVVGLPAALVGWLLLSVTVGR